MNTPATLTDIETITQALQAWRQGDFFLESDLAFVHVARLSKPLTKEAAQLAHELSSPSEVDSDLAFVPTAVPGFIVLTQSCDITRDCDKRPYVELAPLKKVEQQEVENIRRLKRPSFAYVPALAGQGLVADLDRTFTVEKAVIFSLPRTPGFTTSQEATDFAEALSRKRSRFAFPNDFAEAMAKFQKRFQDRAGRQSDEGLHVDALREIRVSAQPDWDANPIQLTFWFIKEHDPNNQNWPHFLAQWEGLVDQTGRYRIEPFNLVDIDDITARDYLDSHRLDYDHLSTNRPSASASLTPASPESTVPEPKKKRARPKKSKA